MFEVVRPGIEGCRVQKQSVHNLDPLDVYHSTLFVHDYISLAGHLVTQVRCPQKLKARLHSSEATALKVMNLISNHCIGASKEDGECAFHKWTGVNFYLPTTS